MYFNKIDDNLKKDIISTYKELKSIRDTKDAINDILERDNKEDRLTYHNVRDTLHEAGVLLQEMQQDLAQIIEEDRKEQKEKKEKITTDRKYKELLIKIDGYEDVIELLRDTKGHKPRFLEIKKSNEKSESTAFWLASDWHVGEVVDPDIINGMNEYNQDIAETRAKNFFKNALRLTDICAKDTNIQNVVLAVLGDMISGYIHDELKENNSMSPTEELKFFKDIFFSGMKYVLDNSNYIFTVIMKDGNHGRNTDKIQVSTRHKNSLEFFLFDLMADMFKDNPRVNFIVEKGIHTYFKVYNKTIRFSHGDMIKYGGGVGGITIPVNKAINQWNKVRWADLDAFGHFHQSISMKNFVCNGSNKGYDPYALSIKAEFEEPQQTFFLMNQDGQRTIEAPIFVNK